MKKYFLIFILFSNAIATAAIVAETNNKTITADDPHPIIARSQMVTASVQQPVITDNNKAILVDANHRSFIISLPANPTTGYSWITQSYDKDLLILKSQKYIAPNTKLIGAPGRENWFFIVKKDALRAAFTGTIVLVYARPWEMNQNKVGKQLKFTVVTADANSSN